MYRCGASHACDFCGQPVTSAQLMDHLANSCPKNVITCPHCPERMERQVLEETHKDTCPRWPLTCDFCGAEHRRAEMEVHWAHCPEMPVPCKLCGQQVPRYSPSPRGNGPALEGEGDDAVVRRPLVEPVGKRLAWESGSPRLGKRLATFGKAVGDGWEGGWGAGGRGYMTVGPAIGTGRIQVGRARRLQQAWKRGEAPK